MFTAILCAISLQVPTGRHLVFSEDYSKLSQISTSKWHFEDGPSYNHEIEKYTNQAGHNAFITGGNLVIEARKQNNVVTSARLVTLQAWSHPYIEVVAKVPLNGKGTWPAIWLLNDRLRHNGKPDFVGWPDCGEVDIMEQVGYDPTGIHFSLHSGEYNWMKKAQRTLVGKMSNPNIFHKFAVDMTAAKITFLLDDKPIYTVKNEEKTFASWPFDDKFYLILNLAIGGDWGAAKGIDESIYPSRFLIKSVRIYQ